MIRSCTLPGGAARAALRPVLLAALVLLAGCASPPSTRLHSLLPAAAATAARAAEGPALAIALTPVVVPVQVDQPQWLVRLPDDTLALLEYDRWASPLPDELRAALREALAGRWGAIESAGATPSWRIAVEVTRFESMPGQAARLESQWTLTPARGAAGTPGRATGAAAGAASGAEGAAGVTCRVVLNEPAPGGTAALAEAHRRAVVRLADQIGHQLRVASRGETQDCAAPGR